MESLNASNVLIIVVVLVVGFYLIQMYAPQEKTKYANNQLLRFIKVMPLMSLLSTFRDWIRSKKNNS